MGGNKSFNYYLNFWSRGWGLCNDSLRKKRHLDCLKNNSLKYAHYDLMVSYLESYFVFKSYYSLEKVKLDIFFLLLGILRINVRVPGKITKIFLTILAVQQAGVNDEF